MTGLYDIHCHILPGVDDGAKSLEESKWLLRKEYEDGVRNIIVTPHFRYKMFEPPLEAVKRQFLRLQEAAEEVAGDLKLYLGCELHSSMDMVSCLKKGERLTMAGSRFVLVEFSYGDEKTYIKERVQQLKLNGYNPIVAHVERYKATRGDLHFVDELKDLGAYIQVNADTISGKDGFGVKRFAKKLMKQDLLDFVGTDGHRKTERTPDMGKCYLQMVKTMGEDYTREILIKNPRKSQGNGEKKMENQIKENQEVEIDLGEIFHVLLGRLGIIILSGIVLGLISIVGTMLFVDPQYESTTKIVVLSKQDNNTLTNQDMQTSTLLTKDYAELIKSRTVTEGVIAELNLDLDHEELLKKISVENQTDTRIVAISVRDEDPYMASQIANAIRDVASVHIQEVMDVDAVNVVETANIPSEPASPSLVKNGILGGMLGVILSVIIILAVYLSNDTVKTPEDVERYLQLSVLGNIPLMDKEKKSKKQKRGKAKKHRR